MAVNVIDVWNQAVSACGNKASISSETENTKAANLCALWYPLVRDNVIKAGDWPSARKYTALALKSQRTDGTSWTDSSPAPGWKYEYSAPSDMLAPRHLHSYAPFDRAFRDDTNVIVSNQEQAILHYMFRQDDVTKWDNDLEMAIIYNLAASLCYALTGVRTLTEMLQQKATEAVLVGQTNIANESDTFQERAVDWFEDRDFDSAQHENRFIYPYSAINLAAA